MIYDIIIMLTLWTLTSPCSFDYCGKNIATVLLLIGN